MGGGPPNSTLTAWFILNGEEGNDSRQYLYQDIPQHFTYNKKERTWHKRRGLGASVLQERPVGRMYSVHPSMGERYYLRILLAAVPGKRRRKIASLMHYISLSLHLFKPAGATSYEDLKRVPAEDGQDYGVDEDGEMVCATFQEAAKRRGLLADDQEVRSSLADSAHCQMPGM